MTDRKTLLKKLIRFEAPVSELVSALHSFGWDGDKEFVKLQRSDIVQVLNQYLQSTLTESDIEEWANAIEGREDIEFEIGYDEAINDAVFELANPLLTQRLDLSAVNKIINRLNID